MLGIAIHKEVKEMIANEKPIGVFDSGIGGLTVAKEIMNLLPYENIIYLGDTARVPYGSKSKKTITQFTCEGVNFLLSKGVKMIVIACNTVSATCLKELQNTTKVPVVGVIQPGARAATKATKSGIIGVIGTDRTIKSKAYERAILQLKRDAKIYSRSCPLFVPLVEEGWLDNEAAFFTAKTYLEPLIQKNIDTLVLACTHYPLLKPTLQKVVGKKVSLVDSGYETAKRVKNILEQQNIKNLAKTPPHYHYYVSDNPMKFAQIGGDFLKRPIDPIDLVDLEKYSLLNVVN